MVDDVDRDHEPLFHHLDEDGRVAGAEEVHEVFEEGRAIVEPARLQFRQRDPVLDLELSDGGGERLVIVNSDGRQTEDRLVAEGKASIGSGEVASVAAFVDVVALGHSELLGCRHRPAAKVL